ncbi:cytochrome P450 [Mytilinidion resinicola]|uniref:Bifunctional cytochrome P450/NADPH--P450 reductase n=1 Tax=Mytilinidion resinicola TaxID=574789 RepID=A0A6A6YLT3_9PEZI|nr:cytochrome P450 [Mytilinidion resinicola]KAF2809760.1 cytochrome P450 [Mytilinidion resinicola]
MVKEIPSPKGLPFVGNLFDLNDEVPTRALERLADQYGPIFKLRTLGRERIIVADHELFEEVCDETRFCKATGGGLASLSSGSGGPKGLFTAPSEKDTDWAQAHRILMPAFGPISVRGMFDEMLDIAEQLVLKFARLGEAYKIPATDDFTRLTLDTIALASMDYRFNSFYTDGMHPFVEAMTRTLQGGQARMRTPHIVQMFMFSANEQMRKDSEFQTRLAVDMVQHRRDNPTPKKDLLNTMIYGKDPKTGEGMRDELIAANMVTFLIAGHETTSGLLSFTFYNLLKNPDTFFKAQQEVDRVIGKERLTVDHLKELHYLNAVLRETLRLTPTAPGFTRRPRDENKEDPVIIGKGDYVLEKDASVFCLLGKIQKDPKVYGEDANSFRPERMLDEAFEKLPQCAWKPFGTGMRGCIGRPFAWQEALLVTAILLQKFNFKMDDPSYELQIKSTLTIKPKDFYMRASLRPGITPTSLQQSLSALLGETKVGELQEAHESKEPKQDGNCKKLTILYGSNTGTCQALAQRLTSDARQHGYEASVADLDSAVDKLPKDQPVVILTASYEGEPTDNAAYFFAWLQSVTGDKMFDGVNFAVFGCGHSDWAATYQRIPTLIESLLESHGATKFADRGCANAAQGDIFSDFDAWADHTFWPSLLSTFGSNASNEEAGVAAPPRSKVEMEISTDMRSSQLQQSVLQGTVVSAKILTSPGEPEKRHLEVQLPEGTEYEAGDYLAVLPLNPDESVKRVLARYALPWDATVTVKSGGPVNLPENTPMSAFKLLEGFVELSMPATKKNVEACMNYTDHEGTKSALSSLSSSDYHTVIDQRVSLLDLQDQYPRINLPFAEFLAMLPPMRLRHYSISSSPLCNPSTCVITYGVIDAESLSGQGRFVGVAGSYLSNVRKDDQIQVSVRKSNKSFHLPSNTDTPLIMFAAGTGLAPFRGFVEERASLLSTGRRLAPALLFIGCRSRTADRLYGDELDEWAKVGAVDLRYAFSRESDASEGCKYVQDRMLQDKEDLVGLWDQGAKVFVCGSPSMVEGVRGAALQLVKEGKAQEGLEATKEESEAWLRGLRNERISVDVFA